MAILLSEPTATRLERALRASRGAVISEATLVELSLVASARLGIRGAQEARAILDAANVVSVPVDPLISAAAIAAWTRFGRGNHPAKLNFGDCFSYATAAHYEVPLLCVGADFSQTDLVLVDVLVAN